MQPRSGDALGGTLVRQRRKVFRGRQRLYGLLARVSRTGSAKDRLYPIKERLFTPQSPHDLPHNQKGEKSRRKNKNHILYLEAHSLYNIWYPWLVLDLQTRNEKRLSCKPLYGSTESIMAGRFGLISNFQAHQEKPSLPSPCRCR